MTVHPHLALLAPALLGLSLATARTHAQDHAHHHDAPQPAREHDHARHRPTAPRPASQHIDHDMRHPANGHPSTDHTAPGHAEMEGSGSDHSGMDHPAMEHARLEARPPATGLPVPVPTDADRAAAFPNLRGHTTHDDRVFSFVQFNRLEAWDADAAQGEAWEGQAWIGNDWNRLWLRSEGERADGRTGSADLEVLYGRPVARWWDLVAGLRHDFAPGDGRTFAGIGVIGMAPYKFEVAATAYVGEAGRTAARVEIEYETLFTNRLILQSLVEADLYAEDDADRGIGAGLSTLEAGFRLRYEVTRRFAPYIGVGWERAHGRTAALRREDGEDVDDTRVVAGVRVWF